jgi:hypothetical protein
MRRSLAYLLLSFAFTMSFAFGARAETASLRGPQRTLDLLQTRLDEAGSIVIANGSDAVAELAERMGVAGAAQEHLIVVTGAAAARMAGILSTHGIDVAVTGTGDQRLLVLGDDCACEILKVLEHVLGASLDGLRDGIVVVKGGIDEVLCCLTEVLEGTIDIGVEIGRISAKLICCATSTALELARVVWEHAGCVVVVTAKGVIIVAEYAAHAVCDVLHHVAGSVWSVAKGAVCAGFHIVDGVVAVIEGTLERVGEILGGCGCDDEDDGDSDDDGGTGARWRFRI